MNAIAEEMGFDPVRSHSKELENLRLLASEAQVREGLRNIASTFGKVRSIAPLVLAREHEDPTRYVFLVDFEDTLDAIAAARQLNVILCRFSALVIKVPKQVAH